ncbi:hypothetical protein C8E87_7148 [Paractinoplanes brasiliensis]|uniref:Uncharacterized protein n=1 Tax=Paractinoplanes brasiliensis TaxID=52695 RepID=A0A4R6J9Y9_9ACTN|nr:hypothetical protein C8E87_7148 [Actinoplanes brasiliensis]
MNISVRNSEMPEVRGNRDSWTNGHEEILEQDPAWHRY